MMNMKDWIVLPQRARTKGLSAEQSYPRLLELIRDLDKERGHSLTDKQVNALVAVIESLINVGACVTYYDEQ